MIRVPSLGDGQSTSGGSRIGLTPSSEFGACGRIEKWDRKADLGKTTVRTLVIGATRETMDPDHTRFAF